MTSFCVGNEWTRRPRPLRRGPPQRRRLLGVLAAVLAVSVGGLQLALLRGVFSTGGPALRLRTTIVPLPQRPPARHLNDLVRAERVGRVERIYYINLAKNAKRRAHMEDLLGKQSIPYERVEARVGQPGDRCVKGKDHPDECRGIAGLARSNLHIIDSLNTTGVTLVLEDDFGFEHIGLMVNFLRLVPPDWDVVRFQCNDMGHVPSTFPRVSDAVYRTVHAAPCDATAERCWFFGETVNMFWRGDDAARTLREVWSEEPYDDVDGRLVTDRLNSYCVDLGMGHGQMHHFPNGETSDIPKHHVWAKRAKTKK